MTPEQSHAITQWVVAEGLDGTAETDLLDGFCERLTALDIPLLRVNISQPTLHPITGGHLFIWRRGEAAYEDNWERNFQDSSEKHEVTPFGRMLTDGASRMRCRIDQGEGCDLPMLNHFRDEGGTEYFAVKTVFGEARRFGPAESVISSWLTDAEGGFTESDIAVIETLVPPLALAVKGASTYRIARSVIETYLGHDAARRVLSGAIERSGTIIRAVLWYADLEGFTKLADTTPRDQLLAMLDDYFDCMVTAVHECDGQVLKFMGDGVLAIFNLDDDAASCHAALRATDLVMERMAAITERRRAAGLPSSAFDVALHIGDVNYGNIGARDRLDFTVVGPAVNEVARIEAMCRALDQPLVISSAFAAAARDPSDRLVSLGRYALRGVRKPQELFTLDFSGRDD